MKRKIAVTLLAVAMAASLMSAVTAQSQDSDVTVNVSDTVSLDARPSAIAFGNDGGTGIAPGANVTTSDEGYNHIDIENIGSVPIEQIHAEATMQSSQTFGDQGNNFDTGNLFVMSTETAQNTYGLTEARGPTNLHYLNRVEYSESNPPEYISTVDTSGTVNDPSGATLVDHDTTRVGRFRVGEVEYFWVLYSNGDATDDGGSWALRYGRTPHTPNQLGTVDFRNENDIDGSEDYVTINSSTTLDTGVTGVARAEGYDLVSFDTSNPSENNFTGQSLLDSSGNAITDPGIQGFRPRSYNLYIDGPNSSIIRASFNTVVSDADDNYDTTETDNSAQFAIYRGTDSAALQPGENFPIDIGVQLPNGIDRSRISTGTVTIIATENTGL